MSNANMPAALGPIHSVDRDGSQVFVRHGNGLTKREHFAAMAMQGYISDEAWSRKPGMGMAKLATLSVEAADALLAELEKP